MLLVLFPMLVLVLMLMLLLLIPLLQALGVMFENSVDGPVSRPSSDCRSQVDGLCSG